ncbi:ParB/RepB/Spo0J family partition protein [Streptomyces noursei]|uniref:ParB/RepB/Spo0J family partition protein n=1 Tax=Streptomyces noursei TaxID=1971 RepID=UPI0038151685
MAPRGQFNRRQEGQRFLTTLQSIAPSPRNLREEWEYETEEFEEFANNVENTELIQDPAVCSVDAFTAKYPEHAHDFDRVVEWVLLAGERRYRALLEKKALTDSVPVVLRDSLLGKGDFVLLSENNFRKGWDPIQEALLLERIRREEGLTYDEILEKLGGEQSAIKRRSDISKRIKLLELQDGDLRRAIRQGQVGLEPAYTLVSRLKKPELIEQGWAKMQADGMTARAVCDVLLGKSNVDVPDMSSSDPVKNSGDVTQGTQKGESAPASLAERDPQSAAAGQQPVAGANSGAQNPAVHGSPTSAQPLASPTLPNGSGFADETAGANEIKVPSQGNAGSGSATAQGSSVSVKTEETADDAASSPEQDIDARMQACAKVLASVDWSEPGDAVRRIAVHALLGTSRPAFDLALRITGQVGLTEGDQFGYVAALEAADDGSVLTMAYAVSLATDELHLRSVGDHLDTRAAGYLKHLHECAGFDITGYQSALEAISSAKL